ncbi:MAG: FitA-like ribbon-helix-helix domain-containing protein [Angustibacter sp.]
MSTLIQIRNVPEAHRAELKARAAAQGESLNRYLQRLIEREVDTPTVAAVLARAARRSERASSSSLSLVQEARREREAELTEQ